MPFDRIKLQEMLTAAETTRQASLKSALTSFGFSGAPAGWSTYDAAVTAANNTCEKSVLLAQILFGEAPPLIDLAKRQRLALASDIRFVFA